MSVNKALAMQLLDLQHRLQDAEGVVKRMEQTGEPFRVALLTLERDSARHGRESWYQAQREALDEAEEARAEVAALKAQLAEAREQETGLNVDLRIARVDAEGLRIQLAARDACFRAHQDPDVIEPGGVKHWLSFVPPAQQNSSVIRAALGGEK